MLEVYDSNDNKRNLIEDKDSSFLRSEFIDVTNQIGGSAIEKIANFIKNNVSGKHMNTVYFYELATGGLTYFGIGNYNDYKKGYAAFIVYSYSPNEVYHVVVNDGNISIKQL